MGVVITILWETLSCLRLANEVHSIPVETAVRVRVEADRFGVEASSFLVCNSQRNLCGRRI